MPPDDSERAGDEQELVPFVPDQGEDETDFADGESSDFSASIGGKDWTVETLVSQMRKSRIDLSPSFQRRNAWLDNRKSKLIESICLGFPIPQIVLAEKRGAPGEYFVLDGKQRLLALRQFFASKEEPRDEGFTPLRLTKLEVLPELNGMELQDLIASKAGVAARLENHDMRTVVLSDWNSERMLLSLFLRLNTGSVPLSPQELRQALIPGAFIQWLDEYSGEMGSMRGLLGNSHPDRRMADAELMLRHLAFKASPLQYRGNLKQFLDETSRSFNEHWHDQQDLAVETAAGLDASLTCVQEAFGDAACRKWSGARFERALNRAVFDVQVHSLSFPEVRAALVENEESVLERYKVACLENTPFTRSISATTKTAEAFTIRHREWASIMRESCGVEYPFPEPLRRD